LTFINIYDNILNMTQLSSREVSGLGGSDLPSIHRSDESMRRFQNTLAPNGEWMTTELSGDIKLLANVALRNALREKVAAKHTNILEVTAEKRKQEDTARAFVESTIGPTPVGDIFWQPNLTHDGLWGSHDIYSGATYVAEREYPSEDLRYMHEMAVLVHEFAHATGDTNAMSVIETHKDTGGDKHFDVLPRFGMFVNKIEKSGDRLVTETQGVFFEEAFAEETAARWRESFSPLSANKGLTATINDREMPIRYIDFAPTLGGSGYDLLYNYPAYAAHAIELVSQITGTDLYKLMVEARSSDNPSEAKKAFIKTIDSLKTGLYRELSALEYTEADFVSGLNRIWSVISD
jgi:hypothetical protein